MATGVQEFCNGGSLRAAVNKGLFKTPHMPQRWGPMIGVLRDVAAGMNYMHAKRICHGDLNPSNILLKVRRRALCMLCALPATPSTHTPGRRSVGWRELRFDLPMPRPS